MQPVQDPYRALGVPRGATDADIKAAHRRLAKRHHPDAAGGDSDQFLKIQEAYRVLSDPLLRREWDMAHAGPVRADRPVTARPRRTRTARPPAAETAEAATEARSGRGAPQAGPETAEQESASRRAGRSRPRSARAYTWTAAEVPWWEEGSARQGRSRAKPAQDGQQPGPTPGDSGDGRPAEPVQDFDVYNRSSGAAWSMAARKYFRRGDQDLPSRGAFRHQGTQPLTAARARAAAEAEARERAAAAPAPPPVRGATRSAASSRPVDHVHGAERQTPPPSRGATPAYAYASAGVARDPERVAHVREEYMRRTRALAWPSLRQRLLYALVAWLPLAALVGYGAFASAGCGVSAVDCPPAMEVGLIAFVGLLLVLLVVLPKVAYAGALGTIVMLLGAAVATGVLAYMRAPLPPATAALIVLGVVMGVAYVTTVLVVTVRGGPWRWATPR